jgi:CHAD domain-containing protein
MTAAALERELRPGAPAGFSLARLDPALDSYTVSRAALRRLHTIYYDTPDLRLARWGASLRYRAGEGWLLKLPQPQHGGGSYPTEHLFPGDGHSVPGAALDLATAMLRGGSLRPVIELRTVRTRRGVAAADGSEVAELVEDDVRVVRAARVVDRFRRVEIEIRHDAPHETLDVLSAYLQREGAGHPGAEPAVAGGKRADEPEVVVSAVEAGISAGGLATAALATDVERLVRIDPRLRLEPDVDAVHDARVIVRRLRCNLRTFAPVLDAEWADDLRERMRWLSEGLSSARDADVLIACVTAETEPLPSADRARLGDALRPLHERRAAAYDRLARLLRDRRYVGLLDALVAAARVPHLDASAHRPAGESLGAFMEGPWRRLRKAVRQAGRAPTDAGLHRIRIKAKHVRYAAEALAPVAGERANRFARRVEVLQSRLGRQHDAVNAARALREQGENAPLAFLAGELTAFQLIVAARLRGRWRSAWTSIAEKQTRFW